VAATKPKLAKLMMSVIPPLMHHVRREMRLAAKSELTVAQFKILANIRRGLCFADEIAEHQGVSQAAISRAIAFLAGRQLITGSASSQDRRRTELKLTKKGTELFGRFLSVAENMLEDKLAALSRKEQDQLELGLNHLEKLFLSPTPSSSNDKRAEV
jgi:DNA-binding MarR family transcriptional regulator